MDLRQADKRRVLAGYEISSVSYCWLTQATRLKLDPVGGVAVVLWSASWDWVGGVVVGLHTTPAGGEAMTVFPILGLQSLDCALVAELPDSGSSQLEQRVGTHNLRTGPSLGRMH